MTLAEAAVALAAVVPDDPLTALLARPWPWRVVVVGRIGVGKTSWCNALSGASAPVGLGGVTLEPRVCGARGVELVDTPGIDDADEAVALLEAIVADADAVVWIVDGLQPVTASERGVVARIVPDGMAAHALVSRFDLVPEEEREAVLARVHQHARGDVIGADLRHGAAPEGPIAASPSSPRRRRALIVALDAAEAALAALPPLPTAEGVLTALRERWRDLVREAEATIEEEIARGVIDHEDTALRLFARAYPHARERFLTSLGGPLPPGRPDLPRFDPPAFGAVQEALAAFAGQSRARRALRAAAGGLVMEGELALADWLAAGLPDDGASARREAAAAAIRALRATELGPRPGPPRPAPLRSEPQGPP